MSTRIRGIFAAAAVVFAISTSAAAQPRPLEGVVHDHMGHPVPGVVVTIEHPQQTAVRVVVTDLRGTYAVSELDSGTRYTVRVSHPHFRKVRLNAVPGDRINVRLKPRRLCRPEAQQASNALPR